LLGHCKNHICLEGTSQDNMIFTLVLKHHLFLHNTEKGQNTILRIIFGDKFKDGSVLKCTYHFADTNLGMKRDAVYKSLVQGSLSRYVHYRRAHLILSLENTNGFIR
jgi:hypothetical protein